MLFPSPPPQISAAFQPQRRPIKFPAPLPFKYQVQPDSLSLHLVPPCRSPSIPRRGFPSFDPEFNAVDSPFSPVLLLSV